MVQEEEEERARLVHPPVSRATPASAAQPGAAVGGRDEPAQTPLALRPGAQRRSELRLFCRSAEE